MYLCMCMLVFKVVVGYRLLYFKVCTLSVNFVVSEIKFYCNHSEFAFKR